MSYTGIALLSTAWGLTLIPALASGQDAGTPEEYCGADSHCLISETVLRCVQASPPAQCQEWVRRLTVLDGAEREAAESAIACAQMYRASSRGTADSELTLRARALVEKAFKKAVESHSSQPGILASLSLCGVPDRAPLLRRAIALDPDQRLLLRDLAQVLVDKGDRNSLLDAARLYRRLAAIESKMKAEYGRPPYDSYWTLRALRLYENLEEKELQDDVVETLRSRLAQFHEIARDPGSQSEAASSALRRVCDGSALHVVGVSKCIETLKAAFDRLESDPTLRLDLVRVEGLGDALDALYNVIALSPERRAERSRFAKMFLGKVEGLLAAGIDLTVLHVVAQDLRRQINPRGASKKRVPLEPSRTIP